MEAKRSILIYSFLLYAATFALGIAAAWYHVIGPSTAGAVAPLELTWQNGIVFAVVFILFTFAMVKLIRVAHLSLSVFLVLVLLAGAQFVFAAWLPWPYDILGALALVVLVRYLPIVLVHDLAIVIGIAGMSALLGLSITPLAACVLLAGLSIYDIVSVYRTKHMIALAERMMSSGAIFGFLVPARLKGFFMTKTQALDEREVMLLGSGDIGLPLVLATSAASQSLHASAIVSVFSLAGLMLMHYLFTHQRKPAPMAALPPIAMSAILGYTLAIILGI